MNFFRTFSYSLGVTLCSLTSAISAQDPNSQGREAPEVSSGTAVETAPFGQRLRERREELKDHQNYLRKNLQYVLLLSKDNDYIASAENIFRSYTSQERAARVATLAEETIMNLSDDPEDGRRVAQHVGFEVAMQSKRPNGTPQQVLQRLTSFFSQRLSSLNYPHHSYRKDNEDLL